MAFIPLSFPPGIYRAGTVYQSKGRYYDCHLVRFTQGTIQPVGGWRTKTDSTVTGAARAIIAWNDNSGSSWAGIGTESNLYAMSRSGTVTDITPSGITAGRADAVAAGGYGAGSYGAGAYGTPRPDNSTVQEASVWSLDTFGEYLEGVMAADGDIYEWKLDTGTAAAAVTNAPTATALLVTQEGMLMALGAASVPRRVKWSDQRDNTTWTPDATNQAGDFDLQTNGVLQQGIRIKGGHLIFTDLDVWRCDYTADTLVYSFTKAGDACGAVSRNCAVALDAQAVWMGKTGFWLYNGYVTPLPCDVWDFVFSDINRLQISKVACEINSAFGEVTWRYPSANSAEIDREVTWNYRENHWSIGYLSRLCGVDAGVMRYPLRIDSSGAIYEHEVGYLYPGSVAPWLESGPLELGNGDNVMYTHALIPDDKTMGDVTATFYTRFYPDGTESTFGAYTLTKKTDVRFCGRTVRVHYDAAEATAWRIGVPRLDATPGGNR